MLSNHYPNELFLRSAHAEQLRVLSDFDRGEWRYALCNWHRRARKSSLSLVLLIRECLRYPRRRYIYLTSTFTAAKSIILRDPNMLRRWLPMEHVEKINESELFVEFKNGSVLSILGSDKPDSIRGVDASGVVIDEAPLCKREVWEEILRPIISQDNSRWAMFIFTPKGKASWVHDLWCKANDNPQYKRYHLTVNQTDLIPKDEIESLRRELPERVFAQEFLGSFEESAASVFKGIQQCISGRIEPYRTDKTYVTGIDLAKVDDFTVITTICREDRHVVAQDRFNQIDWAIQKERILAHCEKYKSMAIVDATGLGSPIVEDLQRQGLSVMPFQITSTSKKEVIERLMVAIEQRLITFPSELQIMIDELGLYSYEITDHGNVKFAAPEGAHDDTVISLALGVYGMRNYMYGKKKVTISPALRRSKAPRSNAGFNF